MATIAVSAATAPAALANVSGGSPRPTGIVEKTSTSGTSGGSQASLMTATTQMQETQMSFNLQYLQLQNAAISNG
jgi:hypothetical protein